ncbi:MAG: hypothetical protein KIT54_04515 [Phycisphaeraceae bacterium]|nr:hypothetical protein [Phycisphaeraceae bacterium]
MAVQPRKKQENIAFFEQRNPIWALHAAALSLSPEEIGELDTLTSAARAAYDAAQLAAEEAKTATAIQNQKVKAMHDYGGELIKKIGVKAEQTGNPSLYALAQIPAPKAPTPIPPVEASKPDFRLLYDGSIELTWDGKVSTGTVYLVQRAVTMPGQPMGPYTTLGFADEKKFVDNAVPEGAAKVTYVVRAKKGSTITPGTLPVNIRFSTGANGVTVAEAA